MAAQRNRVRLIGGRFRRRTIAFPSALGLRPTPDRVRETLFNWLGQDLTGLACLDLFAGSGALAFEAASRGASPVVAVERDPDAVAALRDNARLLGAPVEVHRADALSWLAGERRRFDVVFLDPPYGSDALARLWPLLEARLAPEGRVYAEAGHLLRAPPGWRMLKADRAGQVHYHLAARASEALSPRDEPRGP